MDVQLPILPISEETFQSLCGFLDSLFGEDSNNYVSLDYRGWTIFRDGDEGFSAKSLQQFVDCIDDESPYEGDIPITPEQEHLLKEFFGKLVDVRAEYHGGDSNNCIAINGGGAMYFHDGDEEFSHNSLLQFARKFASHCDDCAEIYNERIGL